VDEPLAVALKFGFLAVLYLFLLWVARSAQRDLSRSEVVDSAQGDSPGSRWWRPWATTRARGSTSPGA
jgi:hypothetical protein